MHGKCRCVNWKAFWLSRCTVFILFGFKLVWITESFVFIAEFKHLISQHVFAWPLHLRVNCAAVWTVIRVDKWSVWHDSNESSCFVPLLVHKHYIALLLNSSYCFIEENFIAIIIIIELSPSPTWESAPDPWPFTTNTTFIHYFDFKSKHCYFKMLFQHCDSFFTQYSNRIFHRDIKLLKQVTKNVYYFSYIITNIQN